MNLRRLALLVLAATAFPFGAALPQDKCNDGASSAASAVKRSTQRPSFTPGGVDSHVAVSCGGAYDSVATQQVFVGGPAPLASQPKSNDIDAPQWLEFLAKIAWPLVALIGFLLYGAPLLKWLATNIRKFKSGEFEIEFSPEAAQKVKESVDLALRDFVSVADSAYKRQVIALDLRSHLQRADFLVRKLLVGEIPKDLRATVHVHDVVYALHTYQLLDYVPFGGGAGRRFSERRGILGQALRLDQSRGAGDALRKAFDAHAADPSEVLVREWAMTRQEALKWHESPRSSFLCVLLRLPDSVPIGFATLGRTVGVFYMDSHVKNAFGDDEQAIRLANELENYPEIRELARAVEDAMNELRKSHIHLTIEND